MCYWLHGQAIIYTYVFTQNLISIELKGSDRNLLFNLIEEIKALPEFNMATEFSRSTEVNRTTEFSRTRTSSYPLKNVYSSC